MLRIQPGDIWDYNEHNWCVITTNIGWNSQGLAVMGAGIAKQAAYRYPELQHWYGEQCRSLKELVGVSVYKPGKLLLFPTKALNKEHPHLSWRAKSEMWLIENSLNRLVGLMSDIQMVYTSKVYLPPVGCGHGGLNLEDVYPLLEQYLGPGPTEYVLVK